MKPEDNEALTAVGSGTTMGALLRRYWAPAIRSSALEADGAPVRVTLFGDKFVAFRTTDGRAGFVDEACPHRGVSLALARNEDNGLRCIFHGWKLDATGQVVDAPCEPESRRENFCKHVRSSRYAVREAAGVVWVYLGEGAAPPFPDFEFNRLPPELKSIVQGLGRQALHAAELGFEHPVTHEEMFFEAPLPPDLQALEDGLDPYDRAFHRT